jgi:hypothetical protein
MLAGPSLVPSAASLDSSESTSLAMRIETSLSTRKQ